MLRENPAPSYYAESADPVESARLIRESELLTISLGDLVPKGLNMEAVRRLLDLGCGPGGWITNMLIEYPSIEQAIGIDNSSEVLSMAQALAVAEDIYEKSTFLKMDATCFPLAFPTGSFDLVHLRFGHTFVPRGIWPALLAECFRLLSPGGAICVTEFETGFTSSQALEEINILFAKGMYEAGHGFSATGHGLGIVPRLPRLLRSAGFEYVQLESYMPDLTEESAKAKQWNEEFITLFTATAPYVLERSTLSPEALMQVFVRTKQEMAEPDHSACLVLGTCWGIKPLA